MKNTLLTLVALLIASTAASADSSRQHIKDKRHEAVMLIIQRFDDDQNQSFTRDELTRAFSALIDRRAQRISTRNKSNIVFSPIASDVVDYVFAQYDNNDNNTIEQDELLASKGTLRKFDLQLNAKYQKSRT